MLRQYVKYRRSAKGAYALHSPFAFDFYNELICFKGDSVTQKINRDLRLLKKDRTPLALTPFGAGSRSPEKKETVGSIAKKSGTTPRWGRFLYRLSQMYGDGNIIELGGNLGIGTQYLCAGNSKATVHSFEGSKEYCELAQNRLSRAGHTNVKFYQGRIQETLGTVLKEISSYNIAFIDADHSYNATLEFFHTLLKHKGERAILVFDDIYWSRDMTKAWTEICAHEQARVTMDLFFKGVVSLNSGLSKEHYKLKHWK